MKRRLKFEKQVTSRLSRTWYLRNYRKDEGREAQKGSYGSALGTRDYLSKGSRWQRKTMVHIYRFYVWDVYRRSKLVMFSNYLDT